MRKAREFKKDVEDENKKEKRNKRNKEIKWPKLTEFQKIVIQAKSINLLIYLRLCFKIFISDARRAIYFRDGWIRKIYIQRNNKKWDTR